MDKPEITDEEKLKREFAFDLYGRYAIIRDIINANRQAGERFRVLDVGGRGNIMRRFLPNDEVFYLDPYVESDDDNYIEGDGCNMPLGDESFDFVVSADVFEHIPRELRTKFLEENTRVAKSGAVLVAPFYSEEVYKAEINANESFKMLSGGVDHRWLKEHIDNGLPSEDEIISFLKKNSYSYQRLNNNVLTLWPYLTSLMFLVSTNFYEEIREAIYGFNNFYNTKVFPFDSSEPSYRKIFFIKKSDRLTDLKINNGPISNRLFLEVFKNGMDLVNRVDIVNKSINQQKSQEISNLNQEVDSLNQEIGNLNQAIQQKNRELEDALSQLTIIHSSVVYRIFSRYHNVRDRLFPEGTRRSRIYMLFSKAVHMALDDGLSNTLVASLRFLKRHLFGKRPALEKNDSYQLWIERNEPGRDELLRQGAEEFKDRPRIGIFSFIAGASAEFTADLMQSAIAQSYKNWNLLLLITPNVSSEIKDSIEAAKEKEPRMKALYLNENTLIAKDFGGAIKDTNCDFITFVDCQDLIAPFALYELAKAVGQDASVDFVYSDEDEISPGGGRRHSPLFKPDWSPDTLRSYNYIGRLFACRKQLLDELSDLNLVAFEEGEEYDLVLHATERARKIAHIPKVLYHRREKALSYYSSPVFLDIKNEGEYRERLLQDSWAYPDNNRKDFKFSLVILNRDKPEYIIPLLESLRKGELARYYEVIVGDTGTTNKQVLQYYQKVSSEVRIIENLQYHFSKNYNYLIANHANGEIVCLMNNDLILPDMKFLNKVEDIFTDESIGAVGMKLLYPDGKLQHGGVFFFEDGDARGLPYHRLHRKSSDKLPEVAIEFVPAATGAFLFCKKADFISLHGFDENYQQEAQDIDLCLKYRRSGKEVAFANISNIVHIENGTRAKGDENWHDRRYFLWKWKSFLEATVLGMELNKEFKANLEEVNS